MVTPVRRLLTEVLALYTFEPDLRDLYVEGASDKSFYGSILANANLHIIEIDSIDFSTLYDEKPYLRVNNRKKVIELSSQLFDHFGSSKLNVYCIADIDFDTYKNSVVWNCYLLYTDYSSLEMYFFNDKCLELFFNQFLYGFPFSARSILDAFTPILRYLFFLELIAELAKKDVKKIEIKKSISIDRINGSIFLKKDEYLKKFLISNGLINDKNNIESYIEKKLTEEEFDLKYQIKGHEYVHLLFLYVNKIKNHIGLNEEVLSRILCLCVSKEELQSEYLIKRLIQKYT